MTQENPWAGEHAHENQPTSSLLRSTHERGTSPLKAQSIYSGLVTARDCLGGAAALVACGAGGDGFDAPVDYRCQVVDANGTPLSGAVVAVELYRVYSISTDWRPTQCQAIDPWDLS